jgi:lipopolysaccharide heptosyltransferase II
LPIAEPSPWQAARHVLAIRLDSLGDVLMATPALRAVAGAGGERRVSLLTSPAGAAIAALVPEVSDVLTYAAPWMKASPARADARQDTAFVDRLRQARFDAAVIFTTYSQSPLPAALLCYLAEIPLRLAHCRENPYQLLTDWVRESEPEQGIRHEVRRQLDLVEHVGYTTDEERLSLRVPPAAAAAAQRVLAEAEVDERRRWLVLHPGASAPSRRYPIESYAVVASQLAHELGCQVVLTGSGDERELVHELRARMTAPAVSLVGQLSLAELAGVIARAPLVLTNNTGPAHMAAAVGTPVVDLYALTNPQHTPWAVPSRVLSHDVPCRYCYKSVCPLGHHACLRLVPPADVVAAAKELLGA